MPEFGQVNKKREINLLVVELPLSVIRFIRKMRSRPYLFESKSRFCKNCSSSCYCDGTIVNA